MCPGMYIATWQHVPRLLVISCPGYIAEPLGYTSIQHFRVWLVLIRRFWLSGWILNLPKPCIVTLSQSQQTIDDHPILCILQVLLWVLVAGVRCPGTEPQVRSDLEADEAHDGEDHTQGKEPAGRHHVGLEHTWLQLKRGTERYQYETTNSLIIKTKYI